jgi:hypothetical protein
MSLPKPILVTVIAAHHGWQVVLAAQELKGGVCRIPVIAWQVEIFEIRAKPGETFSLTTPVTLGGPEPLCDYALEYGNQPPLFGEHRDFDSVDGFLEAYRQKGGRR